MRGAFLSICLVVLSPFFFRALLHAQSQPVAVNDTIVIILEPGSTDTFYVNLLLNDYDPDGAPIEIAEIIKQGGGEVMVWNDSCMIKDYSVIQKDLREQVYKYRVREVNDTNSLSNWAWVNFNPAQCPDCPIALNDTVDIIPGHTYPVNVLSNDYHPLGDSIFKFGNAPLDSVVMVYVGLDEYSKLNDGFEKTSYIITDSIWDVSRADYGLVYARISHNSFFDSLDVNNINARFNVFGMHFQTFDQDYTAHFKAPRTGQISTQKISSFWIGGLDEDGTLHLSAERYRQSGVDFMHGPVSESYDSLYDIRWFYVWKLTRADIEYHRIHWNDPGYEPLEDILTWPGNGEVALGQSGQIAPYEDNNGNGLYEPLLGDVPKIKGDQALFFVFNDAREVINYLNPLNLGIEVHGMAYAFDAPQDSALWNTVFLHYDILNRSDTSYQDVYLGVFNHFMMGYEWDNFIESDVRNGMIICYNGDEFDDDNYFIPGYGYHPPAQGVMVLGGPYLTPDGIDNPATDLLGNPLCDKSFNGLNFGDGIIDNERMGLSFFNAFTYGDDPNTMDEYYNYLRGMWNDGSFLQYGGWAYFTPYDPNVVGPACRYVYPGDSDPVNWGTYGLWPNGGMNQNGLFWNERDMVSYPSQRRGMGSCGPFDLPAGGKVQLDLAFPWARDYDGTAWESALLLKERAIYLRHLFETDPAFVSGLEYENVGSQEPEIIPNPTKGEVKVVLYENTNKLEFSLHNLFGRVILEGFAGSEASVFELDLSNLPSGHYILKIISGKNIYSKKIVKL